MLAGNAEKDRQSRAGGHKDRVVVLVLHQLVDGDALADDHVGLELDAHPAQVVHLALDNRLGQAKLRDAVDQHAAQLVQSLKDAHAMALLDQVSGGAQSPAGPLPTMATLLPVARRVGGQSKLAAGALVIGDEALQVADGHGRALLAQHAAALALVLLRADAAGDGGQRVVLAQLGRRGKIVARIDQRHDLLDLHAHRAIDDAAGLGALDAARGLGESVGGFQALVHFLKVAAAHLGVQLRHVACAESSCAP